MKMRPETLHSSLSSTFISCGVGTGHLTSDSNFLISKTEFPSKYIEDEMKHQFNEI